jgi:hypothetical protein
MSSGWLLRLGTLNGCQGTLLLPSCIRLDGPNQTISPSFVPLTWGAVFSLTNVLGTKSVLVKFLGQHKCRVCILLLQNDDIKVSLLIFSHVLLFKNFSPYELPSPYSGVFLMYNTTRDP